ncbi:MAG: DUF3500 domain-containing protein [Blastocatellia bacterium]
MKRNMLALLLAIAAIAGLATAVEINARVKSAAAMTAAANKFLASLDAAQRGKATYKFDDEQRLDWHFIPKDRKGLPLKEMNDAQRATALSLLKTSLSQRGFWKAETIMSLENVLQIIEGPNRRFPRDPGLYYVTVFGEPGKGKWGWRWEGHHMSQNFTINGMTGAATSPSFFGTNPAEVRIEHPKKGLRVLSAEEDLSRELITMLDEKQRAQAIYDPRAHGDILTMNNINIKPLENKGISAAAMTNAQFDKLTRLVDEYCNNVPEDLAALRRARFKSAKRGDIYFAWTGGIGRNDPNYHRVQAPAFLIEYDDTQNDANHIHSVWRDFNGDFGRDMLAEHYRETPHQTALNTARK